MGLALHPRPSAMTPLQIGPRYGGPFQIVKQIPPVSYCLLLPREYLILPTFHISLMKPAGGPTDGGSRSELSDVDMRPFMVDGTVAYFVIEIVDSRPPGGSASISGGLGGVWPTGTILGHR